MLRFWLVVMFASMEICAAESSESKSIHTKLNAFDNALQPNQYFIQAPYDQYSYGYRAPHSSKQEVRTADGVTRGAYNYLDATGVLQTVQYVADADGFHVDATNLPRHHVSLPQPVTETPEVAAARAEHLAAHARLRSLPSSDQSKSDLDTLPQPVTDTPEVAAAKIKFFQRYEEELRRHNEFRQLRATPKTLHHPEYVLVALPQNYRHDETFLKTLRGPLPQRTKLPA